MPDPSPSQRKFTSPSSRGNVDVPRPRRPIPKRDQPLPGTKLPSVPTESAHGFRLTFETAPFSDRDDRLARVFACLCLLTALPFVLYLCLGILEVSWLLPMNPFIIFLGLALIHVFAIFSQIASNGRTALGNKALLIAWGGGMAMIVISMMIRKITQ